jgi:hypothetical protein
LSLSSRSGAISPLTLFAVALIKQTIVNEELPGLAG